MARAALADALRLAKGRFRRKSRAPREFADPLIVARPLPATASAAVMPAWAA
jgi:hypothetical protein